MFVNVLAKDVLETYAAKRGEVSKGIQVDINIDASNFSKSVCVHRPGLVWKVVDRYAGHSIVQGCLMIQIDTR